MATPFAIAYENVQIFRNFK